MEANFVENSAERGKGRKWEKKKPCVINYNLSERFSPSMFSSMSSFCIKALKL